MAEKKYYPEMDKLRGAAILMVLLYHSILVYPVDLTQNIGCRYLHAFLWMTEMPLFFLVSGFCFRYGGGYGPYLTAKIKRILVPHLVFGAADTLMRVVPNPLVHRTVNYKEALREFFLYGANDWFLMALFVIFAAAPALHWLLKRRYGAAALLLVGILAYGSYRYVPNIFCLKNSSWFLIYFVIGMILREKMQEGIPVRAAALIPAALIGGGGFYLMQNQFWMVHLGAVLFGEITIGYVLRLMLELAASLGICYTVYCLVSVIRRPDSYGNRFLMLCSRYSLQMYLLDGYALVLSRSVLIGLLHLHAPALIILGNFVADTAIVLAVTHWILKRFRLTRVLCGMKQP